jgi:hypothetical protein
MKKPVVRKKVLVVMAGMVMVLSMALSEKAWCQDATMVKQSQSVKAHVSVGGEQYKLKPNELGVMPRVVVPSNGVAEVTMSYEGGKEGEKAVVQVQDGGTILESGSAGHLVELDKEGKVHFKFQVTEQLGIYRVVVRRGSLVTQLDFWVGTEQQQGGGVSSIPTFGANR